MAIIDPYRFTIELVCGGCPKKLDFDLWYIMYHDIGRSVALSPNKDFGNLNYDKIYKEVLKIRENQDLAEYERLKNKYTLKKVEKEFVKEV